MTKQKILSDILSEVINGMSFSVKFTTATDNHDGTFTIGGICDLHHAQPGFTVSISGHDFVVNDYSLNGNTWNLILNASSNSLPVPGTFTLYTPYFFHGTPIQQENELTKIPLDKKTPMIYLAEPYETENDYSIESSIGSRSDIRLCFLTQADIPNWLTEDFYHNAINPMYNLAQDVIERIRNTPKYFYVVKQKASPKFYTKFGINIKDAGTKKLYFSENLSGCSLDIRMEIYRNEQCCC